MSQSQETRWKNQWGLWIRTTTTGILFILLLQAAKRGKSLREIRKHTHIGNDTQRYTLMKQWLEMNGYTLQSQQKVEASL